MTEAPWQVVYDDLRHAVGNTYRSPGKPHHRTCKACRAERRARYWLEHGR